MNAGEMPPIKVGLVEETEPTGPYGAKSIGECSVVPSAGAIANAVANAIGCEVHRLPLNRIQCLNSWPGKMRQLKEGMESPYEI